MNVVHMSNLLLLFLSLSPTEALPVYGSQYGSGHEPVVENVDCTSDEENLKDCPPISTGTIGTDKVAKHCFDKRSAGVCCIAGKFPMSFTT